MNKLYICNDCGRIMRENELKSYTENIGDFWGTPSIIEFDICSHCGSDDLDEIIPLLKN